MKHSFIQDLEERKRHVRHYLAVVMIAERTAKLGTATVAENGRLLMLRAGTFLILYNLIEASVRGAVEAIHDKISSQSVPFDRLSPRLRSEIVRKFKSQSDTSALHTRADFSSAFVAVALGQEIKMSGTIDARSIRALGDRYGFSCETQKTRTRDGSDLLIIKNKRNDLAHGLKTFDEVGRDFTSKDLVQLSRRTICFMTDILMNIASYLENQSYLEKPET